MSTSKDNIFVPFATGDDITHLFRLPDPSKDEQTLFSDINISSLTKQFTALPVEILPSRDVVPESTLFGVFSEDVNPPSSPVSSILSSQEDVTQLTLPDDDVWQHADEVECQARKVDIWESFGSGRENLVTGTNPFVTEQRPKVFDKLLRRHMNHIYSPNESGVVVDEHLFREVYFL